MSLSSTVSLGALRIQAQQRSDLENNPNISTPEWNQYISQSVKELIDLLVSAYGNEYFVQTPYQFTLNGSQFYSLPSDFYKLLGVDLYYTGSPTGWVTLRRFEFIERNKYLYPNTPSNFSGYTNLRYRLMGNQLQFIPIPAAGQPVQVWYIPEPTSLQFVPTCSTTAGSTTIGVSDSADLAVGMNIAGLSVSGSGISSGATISSINTSNNTCVISSAATLTQAAVPLSCWTDAATVDGIAGWEEYVVIDAAIKALIKQEQPIEELRVLKLEMKARIEAMAEGRDAGQAHHVSDVMSINGFGYDGFGDGSVF